MFEESASSIPSIWASMNSWFTPTVLFVLLNVMICTIAFTSSLSNQKQQLQRQNQTQDDSQQQPQQPILARSPSVLQRIRSINFYSYRSQESHASPPITTHFDPTPDSYTHYAPQETHHLQTPESETQFFPQQSHFEEEREAEERETEEEEEEKDEPLTLDEVYSQLKGRHVDRTTSDTKPAAGEMPARLPARMRKSASVKSPFAHFEEEDIVEARRPATMREGKPRLTEEDEEVDAKADDFINKFKQQLKLQRLDSILGYKEVINRGRGK